MVGSSSDGTVGGQFGDEARRAMEPDLGDDVASETRRNVVLDARAAAAKREVGAALEPRQTIEDSTCMGVIEEPIKEGVPPHTKEEPAPVATLAPPPATEAHGDRKTVTAFLSYRAGSLGKSVATRRKSRSAPPAGTAAATLTEATTKRVPKEGATASRRAPTSTPPAAPACVEATKSVSSGVVTPPRRSKRSDAHQAAAAIAAGGRGDSPIPTRLSPPRRYSLQSSALPPGHRGSVGVGGGGAGISRRRSSVDVASLPLAENNAEPNHFTSNKGMGVVPSASATGKEGGPDGIPGGGGGGSASAPSTPPRSRPVGTIAGQLRRTAAAVEGKRGAAEDLRSCRGNNNNINNPSAAEKTAETERTSMDAVKHGYESGGDTSAAASAASADPIDLVERLRSRATAGSSPSPLEALRRRSTSSSIASIRAAMSSSSGASHSSRAVPVNDQAEERRRAARRSSAGAVLTPPRACLPRRKPKVARRVEFEERAECSAPAMEEVPKAPGAAAEATREVTIDASTTIVQPTSGLPPPQSEAEPLIGVSVEGCSDLSTDQTVVGTDQEEPKKEEEKVGEEKREAEVKTRARTSQDGEHEREDEEEGAKDKNEAQTSTETFRTRLSLAGAFVQGRERRRGRAQMASDRGNGPRAGFGGMKVLEFLDGSSSSSSSSSPSSSPSASRSWGSSPNAAASISPPPRTRTRRRAKEEGEESGSGEESEESGEESEESGGSCIDDGENDSDSGSGESFLGNSSEEEDEDEEIEEKAGGRESWEDDRYLNGRCECCMMRNFIIRLEENIFFCYSI